MDENAWDISKSCDLYNLSEWGAGYFDINAQGEMTVTPFPDQSSISLYELASEFAAHGLSFPVLVRFPNILHHRVQTLCHAFAEAMAVEAYQARYTAVYPIKVNQQHHVVQELLHAGSVGQVGLEAGSKSELLAVLALAPANGGVVICNGYKDHEYIRLALIGQQLGLVPYLVIEKSAELALILEESQQLGITPRLGVRVRLSSIAKGKWQNTGGEKAKFGLAAAQLLDIIQQIQQAGLLDSLQLMHFHMGSQIANVRDVQTGLREAAQYYAELHALGAPIHTIDVGGGLGVDYDGTHSRTACSINYSVQEYANNVIHEFAKISTSLNLPQPHIITEVGRAMTAHHAVLITNVLDVEPIPDATELPSISADEPSVLRDLDDSLRDLNARSALEAYHDALYWLSEAHSLFTHGVLNLTQRAKAEQLYYAICWRVRDLLQSRARLHREVLDDLADKLADKYFCNFSLFQSVPDAWAIDQLFPIMPLHRLQERPDRRATLQDLTCDSDGQFEYYVDAQGVESSLPVHQVQPGDTYLLGIFLVGAYQEILGDMHNLFGDTCSVNVHLNSDGSYTLVEPLEGDTVQDMLRYVNIDSSFLRNRYRKRLQAANLNAVQRREYQRELEAGLVGYTYLEM